DGGDAGPVVEAGVEPGVPADVAALLARLGDAAGEHLADIGRVDSGAPDQGELRVGEHGLRFQSGQPTTALADRRTDGLDDHGVTHAASHQNHWLKNHNVF